MEIGAASLEAEVITTANATNIEATVTVTNDVESKASSADNVEEETTAVAT